LQNFGDGRGTAESAANRQTTPQLIKNYTHRAAQSSERRIGACILSQWFLGPIIKRVDTVITAIPLCSAACNFKQSIWISILFSRAQAHSHRKVKHCPERFRLDYLT
jgi:hypothetical protein